MVIETVASWELVFEQVRRMQAAGLIDALRLVYVGPLTGRNVTQFEPIGSGVDLESLADALPRMHTQPFTRFDLERGDDEIWGGERGKLYRVLLVRASGHLAD